MGASLIFDMKLFFPNIFLYFANSQIFRQSESINKNPIEHHLYGSSEIFTSESFQEYGVEFIIKPASHTSNLPIIVWACENGSEMDLSGLASMSNALVLKLQLKKLSQLGNFVTGILNENSSDQLILYSKYDMLFEFDEFPDIIHGIITNFQGDEDLKSIAEKNSKLSIPVVLFLFSHSIPTGAEQWAQLFVANSNSTNFAVDSWKSNAFEFYTFGHHMDGENRKWENGLTFEILETFSSFSHNLKISDKNWLPVNSTYLNYVDLTPTDSG